jgi:hypothetical protein
MLTTLKQLKTQLNKLAQVKIEEASKQIEAYVKVVESEQKRRSK